LLWKAPRVLQGGSSMPWWTVESRVQLIGRVCRLVSGVSRWRRHGGLGVVMAYQRMLQVVLALVMLLLPLRSFVGVEGLDELAVLDGAEARTQSARSPSQQRKSEVAWITMVERLNRIGDVDLDPRQHTFASLKRALGTESMSLEIRTLVRNEWEATWNWAFVGVVAGFVGTGPKEDAAPWRLSVSQRDTTGYPHFFDRPVSRLPDSVRLRISGVRLGDTAKQAKSVFGSIASEQGILRGIEHRGTFPGPAWELSWTEYEGAVWDISVREKGYRYLP